MKFKKEFLKEMIGEGVERHIIDQRRWETSYEEIFEHEGKHYRTYYDLGSTECQENMPYEYDDDEIECDEVIQVEQTVMVWQKKPLASEPEGV